MKFKPTPKHGTDEDIRKVLLLNYPGCKTIAEALAKQTEELNKSKPSPSQEVPKAQTIVEVYNDAVRAIESYLDGFDIDLLDPQIRFELTKMPISTIGEITLWKEAWLNVEKKQGPN